MINLKHVLAASLILAAVQASASAITGNGSPITAAQLAGGTVIDFDGTTSGDYSSLSTGGVTFKGVDAPFTIGTDYNGNYNTNGGKSLYNGFDNTPRSLRFDFSSTVSAFGFNWGAADYAWTLNAYSSGGSLLESLTVNPTYASNNKEFFGIATAGISYATLATNSGDYIFLDNFTYASGGNTSVPEPSSILLFGLGLFGLAAARRIARK